MEKPILSILIPTYNRHMMCKRLLTTLLPIMQKWHVNLEVIVANDGGDGAKAIEAQINTFTKMGCNLRFIDNKVNKGIFKMRHQLLSEANGFYAYFLDDDDYVNTVTLDSWLKLMYLGGDITNTDVFIFNMAEFSHTDSPTSGFSNQDKFQYYSTKTKLAFNLNSVIWNMDLVKRNLDILGEAIEAKLESQTKNIGEDAFCSYHIIGRANPNINQSDIVKVVISDVLTMVDYNRSNEHMAFTDRDTNYVKGVATYRNYINHSEYTAKSLLELNREYHK